MSRELVKLCPACGTRAKAKWEFCPRCGEALGEAELPVSDAFLEEPVAEERGYEAEGLPWKSWIGLTALLAAGIAGFVVFRGGPSAPANPDLFTIPTLPSAPPPVRPIAAGPAGSEVFARGRRLLAEGKVAEALAPLSEAVSQDSSNALYRHTYGRALWLNGDLERAASELEEAALLQPGAAHLADLARIQRELGRGGDALTNFEKAASLSPDDIDLLRDYGALLARTGDRARANDVLKRVAAARENDAALQQEIAHDLEQAGDLPGAEALYRRVVGRVADAPLTTSRLAEVLFQQNRKEEAVAVLREAVEKTPARPLLHRSLGSLFERSGQIREAIGEYREYARLAPNDPDAKQLSERAAALEQKLAADSAASESS